MTGQAKQEPKWREFEKSVARFVTALSPNAHVTHDFKQRDRHHAGVRQRDIWVNATLLGHFPVVALISCKRWKRKLSTTDVEHFDGELRHSGANVGVLYSYSGYTKGAIDKAKALHIACCQLFEDCPPQIPVALPLLTYVCRGQAKLELIGNLQRELQASNWGEIFNLHCDDGRLTLDAINDAYLAAEESSASNLSASRKIPQPFLNRITIFAEPPRGPLWLQIVGRWKFFRAITEAHIVNGSYEVTGGDFKGSFTTPWIDRFDPNLGPGWEVLPEPPVIAGDYAILVLRIADIRPQLIDSLGNVPVGAKLGT